MIVCYEDGIFQDPAISIKEVDGEPCYFNTWYLGYSRNVLEYAEAMCLISNDSGRISKHRRMKFAFRFYAPEGTLGYFGYSKKGKIRKEISEYLQEKNDSSRVSALLN